MIMIAITMVLGYQGIRVRRFSQQLDQQLEKAEKEIGIESQILEDLQKQYEELDSLKNVERVARDKLGLVKDDEIIFRIKP